MRSLTTTITTTTTTTTLALTLSLFALALSGIACESKQDDASNGEGAEKSAESTEGEAQPGGAGGERSEATDEAGGPSAGSSPTDEAAAGAEGTPQTVVITSCYHARDKFCAEAPALSQAEIDMQRETCISAGGRYSQVPCPAKDRVAKCESRLGTAYYYSGHVDETAGDHNENVVWGRMRKFCEMQKGTFEVE